MSSQSSYVYNEHPAGLGRIAIRETDPMFYDDRMILQPVDSYSSGGSTTQRTVQPTEVITPTVKQPVLQPIITTTTSKPKTGGSHPIVNPETNTSSEPSGETTSRAPIVKVEGDYLVINGNHRIEKKKAVLVGGGLIGAAVLLKLVL